jgi:Esterase-like activity of phytase
MKSRVAIGVALATTALVTVAATGAQAHQPARHGSLTSAVTVDTEHIPALATIGGVSVGGSGYGSAVSAVPGTTDEYYGLTDRGPNVDGPNGTKVEPLPDFTPAIGKFKLEHGTAVLLKSIPLRAKNGHPMNGQVNSAASTGETITDLDGNLLPTSPYGLDSEGLVAMKDGSFYVSDEYGPFIVHFDKNGREISRFSPQSGTLPAELADRTPNKGMEGLTLTPDGSTLVGVMQSALTQSDSTAKVANIPLTRIVTINLHTHTVHEYPYLLQDPSTTGSAISEITAVSNTTFLVDERDGDFEPGAFKRLYLADISHATDIGPAAHVKGATYAKTLGLTVGGKSLEALVGATTTAAATATLESAHITPATKALKLDLGALLTKISPEGYFFGHDKIEGVALVDHETKLVITNDSDFGISGVTGDTPPFTLTEKLLPNGEQDSGEFLVIDLKKLGVRL